MCLSVFCEHVFGCICSSTSDLTCECKFIEWVVELWYV